MTYKANKFGRLEVALYPNFRMLVSIVTFLWFRIFILIIKVMIDV